MVYYINYLCIKEGKINNLKYFYQRVWQLYISYFILSFQEVKINNLDVFVKFFVIFLNIIFIWV